MTGKVYDISVRRIDGKAEHLAVYRGKVLLVVNVASKCGLTPQYTALEALYQLRHTRGLEILGFPANDFKEQEPGSDAEIDRFCALNYDVHFPLFSKISVLGDGKHPLYVELTRSQPVSIGDGPWREKLQGYGIDTGAPGEVLWNFEKFLVSRDGKVVARFAPDIAPDDPRLLQRVDEELERD